VRGVSRRSSFKSEEPRVQRRRCNMSESYRTATAAAARARSSAAPAQRGGDRIPRDCVRVHV
jgi:hypothetical protein